MTDDNIKIEVRFFFLFISELRAECGVYLGSNKAPCFLVYFVLCAAAAAAISDICSHSYRICVVAKIVSKFSNLLKKKNIPISKI